jgi:hypothetical protein
MDATQAKADAVTLHALEAPEDDWSTWHQVDIAAVLSGGLEEPPPEHFKRSDGVPLLYKGKVSSVAGEPEGCKGWFACEASAQVLDAGDSVLYIDFEDSDNGVLSRMVALGVEDDVLISRFHYIAPEQPLDDVTATDLEEALKSADKLGLVVLDGITQAFSNQGLKSGDNDDVAAFFRVLPRGIARGFGAAVLMIDHVVKSEDSRGRYPIGGGTKLGAIDGVQFKVEVNTPFARGKQGHVTISVTKDRPGHVRANAVGKGHEQKIAEMILKSFPDGAVEVTLDPPAGSASSDPKSSAAAFYPIERMTQISQWLDNPNVSHKREEVYAAVGGRRNTAIKAVEHLLADGYVEEITEGRARVLRNVGDFPPPPTED